MLNRSTCRECRLESGWSDINIDHSRHWQCPRPIKADHPTVSEKSEVPDDCYHKSAQTHYSMRKKHKCADD